MNADYFGVADGGLGCDGEYEYESVAFVFIFAIVIETILAGSAVSGEDPEGIDKGSYSHRMGKKRGKTDPSQQVRLVKTSLFPGYAVEKISFVSVNHQS